MRYYISDLHFFHKSLIDSMDNRGFESVEAMNEYMIERWNGRVRQNDEVVILGDFSIGKPQETMDILKRLNGKKGLILGNHDWFARETKFDQTLFEWIEPYKEMHDSRYKVILSHYPVFCYNGQNKIEPDGKPRAYMLYGHVHDTYDEVLVNEFINRTKAGRRTINDVEQPIPCNMINCFCMYSDYVPLTLQEWIEKDAERRAKLNQTNQQ